LFFRYNHKGKIQKRRYGLARHVKIDFYIFDDCTGRVQEKFYWKKMKKFYRKNFTGKKQVGKNEKIKKTSR
jgi:hypothetical protein